MPRSRGMEMPQKLSPRAPLNNLKTTTACSEANSGGGGAHRSSPKLDDRRSPRSPLQEVQKKISRVSELEAKLGQAHEELKQLREQLAMAEAAKLEAQLELQETKEQMHHIEPPLMESQEAEEISNLRSLLSEREIELEALAAENAGLRKEAADVAADVAVAHAKEEELGARLALMAEELGEIVERAEKLKGELEAAEGEKAKLEAEMKKLRVQTEQWRKAAETAADVIACDDGDGGAVSARRMAERCVSMDKHVGGGAFEIIGIASPAIDNDGGGGGDGWGRKKGGGIRVLGELWKKKHSSNK